jgi:uncharacterized protein (DUF983 family)
MISGTDYPPVPPLTAGLRARCPRCGRGKLFQGYLTVRKRCEVCGLDFAPHDTGDGPAVFVILILGFVVVGLALWVELNFEPPLWVHAVLWTPTIIGGALLMLRPLKATLVALHYKHRREEYKDSPGN